MHLQDWDNEVYRLRIDYGVGEPSASAGRYMRKVGIDGGVTAERAMTRSYIMLYALERQLDIYWTGNTNQMTKVALITGITGQDGRYLSEFLTSIRDTKSMEPSAGSRTPRRLQLMNALPFIPLTWVTAQVSSMQYVSPTLMRYTTWLR